MSRSVPGIAPTDTRIAAVAILFVIAAGFAWRVSRSQPAPVAIPVFAVDVDASTPELQPVSLALTDTLKGALVNEAGGPLGPLLADHAAHADRGACGRRRRSEARSTP